jgi:hypothetical protein
MVRSKAVPITDHFLDCIGVFRSVGGSTELDQRVEERRRMQSQFLIQQQTWNAARLLSSCVVMRSFERLTGDCSRSIFLKSSGANCRARGWTNCRHMQSRGKPHRLRW